MWVIKHDDGSFYAKSGEWVDDIACAEIFDEINQFEMVWLASYFEARIYTYSTMEDVTEQF